MPAVQMKPVVGWPPTRGKADTDQRSKLWTSCISAPFMGAATRPNRSRAMRSAPARSGSATCRGACTNLPALNVHGPPATWLTNSRLLPSLTDQACPLLVGCPESPSLPARSATRALVTWSGRVHALAERGRSGSVPRTWYWTLPDGGILDSALPSTELDRPGTTWAEVPAWSLELERSSAGSVAGVPWLLLLATRTPPTPSATATRTPTATAMTRLPMEHHLGSSIQRFGPMGFDATTARMVPIRSDRHASRCAPRDTSTGMTWGG